MLFLSMRFAQSFFASLTFALVLGGPGAAAAVKPLTLTTVQVCDDVNEWPPFTFVQPASSEGSRAQVVGYAVDVLERILKPLGVVVRIELLPWLRCLREVESGKDFVMALNASYSEERARRFLLTEPYYDTTHAYFYSRRRYPQGPAIAGLQDLGKFQLCGVHGYNYTAYGLRDEQVDRGALDFSRVIAKLLADRCEIGIEKLEVVQAARYRGQRLLSDPAIAYAAIPGMPKGEFHMIVSRQHPQGQALVDVLNRGVKTLRARGELDAIRKRYLR